MNPSLRKLQTPILLLTVVVLTVLYIGTRKELSDANTRIQATSTTLLNYKGYATIEYLFEHARREPNSKNLVALTYTLLDRQKKFEALIELHRPQVNESTWRMYQTRSSQHAIDFFHNLANKQNISQEDWATFDRIADTWKQHEEHLKIDMIGLQLTNPTSFTYQYVTLLQDLNSVAPSK